MTDSTTVPVSGHPDLTVTRENYNTAIVQVEFDGEHMDVGPRTRRPNHR